ncbi:HPr kinase/phosphorylase [Roseicyclus persicicus]|uniref:Serine kinase n=1 Tax=Roseicyclus persicicus TaxID=2650661 RepID=A0A7X6GX86_9RHOB|nr:serine kinase [Roseibacterium persicicum]NKX42986.1 serine kinase [Roseibacterium persicicum]
MPPDPARDPIARWAQDADGAALWLHATGVAVDGRGLLILGGSGTGKSGLALELMAHGARLIADDGLWLDTASRPPALRRPAQATGLIEARRVGLLHAGDTLAEAPLALAVDLDRAETDRLPPPRRIAVGETGCPLIHGAGDPRLAPALLLMLRHGRAHP